MEPAQVAGSLSDSVFSGNKAGTSASSAVYRLQSSGTTSGDQGLSSTSNFQNVQPNSTSTSSAG